MRKAVNLQAVRLLQMVHIGNADYYMDPIRQKPVLATPEETVRQKVIRYLLKDLQVPPEMICVEERLSHFGLDTADRADIIIEGYIASQKILEPIAVIECKAENIFLGEIQHKQLCRYADKLNAAYCMLTNGIDEFSYYYDENEQRYVNIKTLPEYPAMIEKRYDMLKEEKVKPRLSLEELTKFPHAYREIGKDTADDKASMCENFGECLWYEDSQFPVKNMSTSRW